jgi:hypothetical protein
MNDLEKITICKNLCECQDLLAYAKEPLFKGDSLELSFILGMLQERLKNLIDLYDTDIDD